MHLLTARDLFDCAGKTNTFCYGAKKRQQQDTAIRKKNDIAVFSWLNLSGAVKKAAVSKSS